MTLKIKEIYSPNFDSRPRKNKNIRFLIFHYTGMKKEKEAIQRLTKAQSEVATHYFIKRNGEIIRMVPDLYKAWHAGISQSRHTVFRLARQRFAVHRLSSGQHIISMSTVSALSGTANGTVRSQSSNSSRWSLKCTFCR